MLRLARDWGQGEYTSVRRYQNEIYIGTVYQHFTNVYATRLHDVGIQNDGSGIEIPVSMWESLPLADRPQDK